MRLLETFRDLRPFHYLVIIVGATLVYRYRWLMDDAYVYFRYADNAALYGIGLVYNAGAYVEGYSSPAWMLLLTTLRVLTPDYHLIVNGLGITVFLAFSLGLVVLNRAISPPDRAQLNLPLLYLAGNYAVLTYFTSGLEAPLVQLIALAFAGLAFFPSSHALQLAVAFSPMIRPELAAPLAIMLAWVGWRSWRQGAFMLAAAVLINAAWLTFRIYYYADLFPNTYHLKNETNIAQGIAYLRDTVEIYLLLPYLLAMIVLIAAYRAVHPESEYTRLGARGVIFACALLVTLYVVKVGGDPRHYRYLAFPFCLVVAGTCGIAEIFASDWRRIVSEDVQRSFRRMTPLLAVLGAILTAGGVYGATLMHSIPAGPSIVVFLILYALVVGLLAAVPAPGRVLLPLFFLLVLSRYPWQLDQNPILGPLGHRQFDKINDALIHRDHARFDWARYERKLAALPPRHSFQDYRGILVSDVCYHLYSFPDFWAINRYGLTDPFLSHVDVPSDRPAHKEGLEALAFELQEIYYAVGPGRNVFTEAIERGVAPDWVVANAPRLDRLARQVYNNHDFRENLRIAFSPVPRIAPPADTSSPEITYPPYL
jgi:hypothetical protein